MSYAPHCFDPLGPRVCEFPRRLRSRIANHQPNARRPKVQRSLERRLDQPILTVTGSLAIDAQAITREVAVVNPTMYFAQSMKDALIARGVTRVIACGGAGVLVPEIALGHVIVPTAAIRDEGTSYHYLAPSREVQPSPEAVAAIVATLERHGVPHVSGKTWTTDALYRETREKASRRVAEGCLTVEMEAAAFFAVARFRGIAFGQLLYAGDDLSGDVWNARGWDDHETGRQQLFKLAAEAVLTL